MSGISYSELAILFGKPAQVESEGRKHTFFFDTPKTDFTFSSNSFPFIRSLETGFDCEQVQAVQPKRKKLRLLKKFAKRYGVKMKFKNVYLRLQVGTT